MKIAVTGANGFLGVGIVKCLSDSGADVIAVDMLTDRVDSSVTCVNGNIFEFENPYVEMGCPDCVLHLAWRDGFKHNSEKHIQDLSKHVSFIQDLIRAGLKHLAIMGSMHEIGFYEGRVDDATPCNPQNMYGIAKNALRQAASVIVPEDVVFQWLRGYYIVDPNPYGSSIFSKLSKASSDGLCSFPFTTGQNQYDFLDYEDFCHRVTAVVLQDEENGIINICSGKPEKLADRVERFIEENDLGIALEYGAFPDRPYDSKAIWGDSSIIDAVINKADFGKQDRQ